MPQPTNGHQPCETPASPTPVTGAATVLSCTADLTWSTRIRSTADGLGIPCRPVRSRQMLLDRLADTHVVAVILELEAGPVCDELLEVLRGKGAGPRERTIKVVAFAPHVHTQAMQAAAARGADSVLARSSFANALPQILAALVAGHSGGRGLTG